MTNPVSPMAVQPPKRRIVRSELGRRILSALLVSSVSVAISCAVALAQNSRGTIRGTVTDSSGAVIPAASVTVKRPVTGEVLRLLTNGAGIYEVPHLEVGTYELTIGAPGFAPEERTGVVVQVGTDLVLDARLSIGSTPQAITAAVQLSNLDLATSQSGGVDSGQQIRDLPLNGRDWTSLASLQPGVTAVSTENPAGLNVQRANRGLGGMVTIGGLRPQQTSYWLDGVNLNDYAGGGPGSVLGISLGVDAVEEFSVITATPPAEYGKTSGGVVNAVSRSGTNQLHGSAYDFLRNSSLDARNFFDGLSAPPFRRNQFGGSIGGPVKRQKTFFFLNYEGIRQLLSVTTVDNVPSAKARTGQLTAGTAAVNPSVIPYLPLFPLPNGPVSGDIGTSAFAAANRTEEDFATARLDHNISDRDRISGTFLFDKGAMTGPDNYNGVLLRTLSRRQVASLEASHAFSSGSANSFRLGLNRVVTEQVESLSAINPLAEDLSLGFLPDRPVGAIAIAGITSYPGGVGAANNYQFHFTSYQAYDNFLVVRGAQILQMGVSLEDVRSNALGGGTNNGGATFGSLAAFLTNQPSSFVATIPGTNLPIALRQAVAAGYVKDDWRLRPNLTVNLGLRYEMATVPAEEHNQLATLLWGSQQLKVGAPWFHNPTLRNFSPRVGFSWDPFHDGKTAVRAGFGVYDSLPLTGLFSLIAILSAPLNLQGSTTSVPVGSFPKGLFQSLALGGPRADYLQQNPRRSYVSDWHFSVQHRLWSDTIVELGYTGSHGVHLPMIQSDINTALPSASTPSGYVWPSPRGSGPKPWPAWGSVTGIFWDSLSAYEALSIRLQKSLARGLSARASYTWSKSLDTSSGSVPTAYTNTISSLPYFDSRLLKAVSDFDVPQTLVFSGTWEIHPPTGLPKSWAWLFSGWQVGSLVTLKSGLPFTATIAGDALGLNSSIPYDLPDRLNLPGCRNPVNSGNPHQYIRLSCFAAPVPSTRLGDAGRNVGRGPGLGDWDTSLFRNIPVPRIADSFRIQFRVEMFNILNRANFQPPTSSSLQLFTQSLQPIASAGALTATATTSRQIQFGLKLLW